MDQPVTANNAAALPIALKLRAGHAEVSANAGRAELISAIEQSNRKARVEGLPDQLDPEIIDADKALAMVRGLSALPPDQLQALAGRTLLLNYPELMVGASAPTTPSSFSRPFQLEIADLQGPVVLARAGIELDCALARKRATEARTQMKSAEGEVARLEAQLASDAGAPEKEQQTLTALSAARLRRFALAQVWQQNARAWSKCPGADRAAQDDLAAASQAVGAYTVQRSGGMP